MAMKSPHSRSPISRSGGKTKAVVADSPAIWAQQRVGTSTVAKSFAGWKRGPVSLERIRKSSSVACLNILGTRGFILCRNLYYEKFAEGVALWQHIGDVCIYSRINSGSRENGPIGSWCYSTDVAPGQSPSGGGLESWHSMGVVTEKGEIVL